MSRKVGVTMQMIGEGRFYYVGTECLQNLPLSKYK